MYYDLKCDKCDKVHNVSVELDEVGSDERQMGPEIYYAGETEIVCVCGQKISLVVEASSYPSISEIEIYSVSEEGATIV